MSDIPSGWPCATLPANPPSVADLESSPSADDLLPQVLPLAPRGPAWGTDEVGDGSGASPVQRRFWRALAAFAADHLGLDWAAATQTFPSAITYTLADWERELGLPGHCGTGLGGTQARIAAVRAKFAAQGGQSPAYFTCVAAAAGYAILIEEPDQFLCDVSEVIGGDPVETWFLCDEGECDDTLIEALILSPAPDDSGDQVAGGWSEPDFFVDEGVCDATPIQGFPESDPAGIIWVDWIVHVGSPGETWFRVDEGEIAFDPIEGFLPAPDLECLLREIAPRHTRLTFAYDLAA